MKQLIFDLETYGSESDSIVLCGSFLVYDLFKDMHTKTDDLRDRIKTFKLNIKDQKSKGRTVNKETMKWWEEQLKIAPHLVDLHKVLPSDLSIEDFFIELSSWLKSQGYNKKTDWAWQRGTMDIMQIDHMFKMIGKPSNTFPILWYKIRDLRTAIDLLGDTELNGYIKDIKINANKFLTSFTKHDPVSDVLLEVEQLRQVGLFRYEKS